MVEAVQLDELAINTIRGLSMDAVQAANSGHPGTPMALAPLGWLLFSNARRHDPADPQWPDRDRFVLSCGHASMLQYSLLHLSGYALTLQDIKNFRQWGSLTPGHPESHMTPGVETTTGPLGQGIGNAVGMAMAERQLAARFNRPGHEIIDHRTWVIASDGDIMEGVAAEAASLAGHLGLGKLIVFWDDNRITIDGSTDLSFTEDVVKRFESYGWHTDAVEDGEDLVALRAAAERAVAATDRPSFIRVRTIIGYPAPNKKDTSGAHGAPLGEEEIAATKQVMGWPQEPFYVPKELSAVTERIVLEGAQSHQAWKQRLEAYRAAFPAEAAALEAALKGELPEGWEADLPQFEPSDKGLATRKASGEVLNALATKIHELVGGSADLAGSNNSEMKGLASFSSGQGVPRNVDWGVREHAMGAAINGMALHGGVIPYAATFLIFSDYMRPALRLASLMDLRTRYIFTHDSIGLGEDGPTHQPVEQLSSLRAIPGFAVFRPADANETRECWKAALGWDGPAALVLTRQNVPTLDRAKLGAVDGVHRGAYVLKDADRKPQVILVATGSEVAIALEAAKQLEADGIATRVVSMPCWKIFEQQDASYQQHVLPDSVKAKVAVEAGVRHGWHRWVGQHGGFVTVDRFGASAPYEELYERYGITPEHTVAEAKRLLG